MADAPPFAVPLCDLNRQYQDIQEDVEAAVLRVLRSGQAILGPEVSGFETEVAAYCNVAHAVGCSNGSDAILLALCALDILPGDEVIVPTFTFFATGGSVCRTGATPVYADIDPITYNLDPEQVERRITPRTKAIIPVHLYGQCADMTALSDIAKRHGLAIIEDAAQAIGSEYEGKRAGTLGDIGCFSFYPSKNLGTYGDAGLVTSNDPGLAARMRALRVHGMEPKYYHQYLGWNARLDAIHAAILRVKLPHLERWTLARQAAAKRYDALIDQAGLRWFLAPPTVLPNSRHVFNQYVVRVAGNDRDRLVQHLKDRKIGCEIYYPVPLHLQECMRFLGGKPGDFPISETASQQVLALPMFPEITPEQQARVMEVCAEFVRTRTRAAA